MVCMHMRRRTCVCESMHLSNFAAPGSSVLASPADPTGIITTQFPSLSMQWLPALGSVHVLPPIGPIVSQSEQSFLLSIDKTSASHLPPIGGNGNMPATGGNGKLPPLGLDGLPTPSGRALKGVKRKVSSTGEPDSKVCRPYGWRTEAYEDIQTVAERYGSDLKSCPSHWLHEKEAAEYLKHREIRVPRHDGTVAHWTRHSDGAWDFWEVYGGCGHATEAFISPATGGGVAGPPVDKIPSRWPELPCFDVCKVECRRLIWSILVICAPSWVHLAPPCTFWSSLSRRWNRRSPSEDEKLRTEALMHLIFSLQICQYQAHLGRYCSFEQPPQAASWHLDIVQDMLRGHRMSIMPATGGMPLRPMGLFNFDSCAWGHTDPGNGLPYKKAQRFASNADMSSLCRKCCRQHVHQIVDGVVQGGPRHGERRSVVAGEYPMDFCMAWARVIKNCRPLVA